MNAQRWGQVKAIFDHAIELTPEARMEFIRETCGTDRELLTEVLSLLASDVAAHSFLENPVVPADAIAALAPPRGALHLAPLVGRTIGNYVVTEELAHGGMGIVYRARHVSLPREVVVKCIRPIAFSAEAAEDLRARFRREACIQAQLDHPHIVRVYEFFDGAEEYFLVMEYVHGSSLRSVLDDRTILPPEQACMLAAQALDGLACAHTLRFVDESGNTGVGVIHRDIKPANMLLDERGNLKLTDFGIAKVHVGDQLTKTGFNPGTAEYMSPEQIRGLPADARSDLYSLGVTLYEMLTGRVPFSRTSAGSDFDVLNAHIGTAPAPIRNLNPHVPPSLADIVDRSLRKDPNQRWQTAAEFREALVPYRENQAGTAIFASAGPGTSRHDFPQWARPFLRIRRVTHAGLAALVLAMAVVGFVWQGWVRGNSGTARNRASVAVLPFVDMSPGKDQEYFSDGLAEELLNELANTPGLRVTGQASSFTFKGRKGDFRAMGNALNAAAILQGSVRKQGNRAKITVQLVRASDGSYLWSGTFDREMNDVLTIETEIARAVTGSLELTLLKRKSSQAGRNTNPEAYNDYLQGLYFLQRHTTENLDKAVGYLEESVRLDPTYSKAWVALGESRSGQAGNGKETAENYGKAREAVERALAIDPDLGEAHAALAWIRQFADWDWEGADTSYKRALALAPGNATVISHAGILARILGRLTEAVSLGREAIERDPLSAGARHNAGIALYYAGLNEEAIAAFQKALELVPEMALPHNFLGRVYLANAQAAEALAEMMKETNPELRVFGLALAHHAAGRGRESDANLGELISRFDSPSYLVAEVCAFRGETDRAFEALEKAYGEHDTGLAQLKGDPLLISLTRDPRYTALLRKMRLPD